MRFEQCPYCQRPVDVMHFPGGWVRISCPACGAQWEAHSGMVRRIADGELFDGSSDRRDAEPRAEQPAERDGERGADARAVAPRAVERRRASVDPSRDS